LAPREIERIGIVFDHHGTSKDIRWDVGREINPAAVVDWLKDPDVEAAFFEKASLRQIPFIDDLNDTTRLALLHLDEMHNVTELRT